MKKQLTISLFIILFSYISFAQDSTMVEVGPGFKFHQVTKASGPFSIQILEIDVSNPNNKIKTALSRDFLGTGFEKTTSLAQRNNRSGHVAMGAINGDYYGISAPTNPYTFLSNSQILNGEFVFGRQHVRSSFGMLENNKPVIDILNFTGTLTASNNSTININTINAQRSTDHLVLYNNYIGISTQTNEHGIEIRLNRIDPLNQYTPVRFVAVEKVASVGNMNLNKGDFILSGHGTSRTFLNNNVNVGDTVSITIGTELNVGTLMSLIGGGPRLINNGIRPSSFVGFEGFGESHVNSRHPRTAIGFSQDSTKVYFVTVDGRQSHSVGMSCAELADYMISIGCYHAVNLDGGGSTTMVVRNVIKNSPSDPGGERSVANALIAVAEIPVNDMISSFSLSPRHILIDSTQTRKININATDLWGYPLEVSATDLTWEIHGINGMIDSAGFFIPFGTGSGIIIGRILNLADTITVSVLDQLFPVWTFSAYVGNLPSWFSTTGSTERGLAYGYVNGQNRLYVVNRPNLLILDANTGDQVGTVSTANVSGGTFPINDVEVSDDGIIFAANLTTSASSPPFKVYKWESETSSAVPVIEFSGTTLRLGDKITVVGSVNDNSAVVYAMGAISNKVFKWTMSNGSFIQTPTEITLNGFTSSGYSPAVYPKGPGNANFFVNGNSILPREYTQAGVEVASLPTGSVDTRSNSMRYIKSGNREFLVVFQYGFPNENAKVFEITGGLQNAILIETTPPLGENTNTVGTSGDVDFRVFQPGIFIYYVLSTNNGFAAYQLVDDYIPVELSTFTASVIGSNVHLYWQTSTETNNLGFEIERASFRQNETTPLQEWSTIGFIQGKGTTAEISSYSFTDDKIGTSTGKIYYRLKQVDFDGTHSYSNVIEVELLPIQFSLEQNYPNPFNPTTKIKYAIPGVVDEYIRPLHNVTLIVYDILGNKVTTLVNEPKAPGVYEVEFNASNLSSGVYFYTLRSTPTGGQAGEFISSKKMLLLK